MTDWFTSDLHLGHTNIIDFADRPFANVTEMNEMLLANWNERVRPEDNVYVLGDYAMGEIMATLNLTRRLMGRKVLVIGNHDRPFTGYRRPGFGRNHREWAQMYIDHGFFHIAEEHWLGIGEIQLRMSHFPYVGDSHEGDRFLDRRPVPGEETLLLHGHVHNAWRYRADPRPMVNVGVDMWNYAPVSLEEILSYAARHGVDLPSGATW